MEHSFLMPSPNHSIPLFFQPLRLDSSIASRRVQERKRVQEMEQDLELQVNNAINVVRLDPLIISFLLRLILLVWL